jgi:GNAT superfamily N-acetyltransferase
MPLPGRFSLRQASAKDVPALTALMNISIRELLKPFLPPPQIEASFCVMGLDTQLIADGTYFVVEEDGALAGCGGWSRRATLFGGDHSAGRDAALLDPSTDAARVRAMYTNPSFARCGVGRILLAHCEAAAEGEGFTRAELAATVAGEPLYLAAGYRELSRVDVPTPSGVTVPLIMMTKSLRPVHQ